MYFSWHGGDLDWAMATAWVLDMPWTTYMRTLMLEETFKRYTVCSDYCNEDDACGLTGMCINRARAAKCT